MARRRRTWEIDERFDQSPVDLRRAQRRGRDRARLAWPLLVSFSLNLLFAALLERSSTPPEESRPEVHELDIVEIEPPVLPVPPAAHEPHKRSARKRARRHTRRKASPNKTARAPEQPAAPPPAPTPGSPPPRVSNLMRMRQPAAPSPPAIGHRQPPSKVDELQVAGNRIRRRRYADGGRLMTNLGGSRVHAPQRASFWRTRKAPKGDAARLSLGGIASMTGSRKGVVCDHFKRFPAADVDGAHRRTLHLLIDSSPSMSGSMSSAEVCAVGVAHSALKKGYAVALGRFGDSTICYPPTRRSALIRDQIVRRQRIGGTSVPTTCGADRAKGAVDVVIVSDGGFFRADTARVAEARRVLRRRANRGMLYLVPDARIMVNPKAVSALRQIGFRVIRFGARRAAADRTKRDTMM